MKLYKPYATLLKLKSYGKTLRVILHLIKHYDT